MRPALLLIALLFTTAAAAGDLLPKRGPAQDFLPVDRAFELQPLERKGDTVLVTFRIAKDYYLYRDRLKFVADPGRTGTPALPPSLKHEDEHFGTTEIYRDMLVVAIPAPAAGGSLSVGYQGCADAGLCYPPQTRSLDLP